LFSCETSRPRPEPAISSGTTSHQPESARGTIGISTATPAARRRKPARMIRDGLWPAAFFPATRATANMLSESGAIESPAWSALYSSTICR
jgi:hypothetical protein